MHLGFNLSLDRKHFPISRAVINEHDKHVAAIVADLRKYLMLDGSSIDAELVAKHLFPKVECDVFISHSYDDREMAIQLVHDLKKKGVHAFVDSILWGSTYDLLRVIDDKYTKNSNGNSYNYNARNRSTAHVHMILATALQSMIMQAPILFFLNTDRSVSTKQSVQGKNMTHSPWIHMELVFSQMIWELEQGKVVLEAAMDSYSMSVPVYHNLPTGHLKSVSSSRFLSWLESCPNQTGNTGFNRAIRSLYLS